MAMNSDEVVESLNRLLAIEYRSLPMYLVETKPWLEAGGDERIIASLGDITTDQKALAGRIADLILDLGGQVAASAYPTAFTDLHFLSLGYLLKELVAYQIRDIAHIETVGRVLEGHRAAWALVQETLGAAKAHREVLESFVGQTASP
jgi:hypothetical protein